MRTRFDPRANQIVESFDRFINTKENLQEIINKNKNKKIFLEIGMGKGEFISQMALMDKDNIYIGLELSSQVLSLAIKKLLRTEKNENIKLDNLYFMSFDAQKLLDYFAEEQIDKLFLNFSDPWPKKRHEKRRLTYRSFLQIYKKVLKNNATVEFKTDNRKLFEYSLVSMQNFGMCFLEIYLDLHSEDFFNISTEYERKFSPNGPIYKLIAKF